MSNIIDLRDNIRATERPSVMPRVSPRALPFEIECVAFEVERQIVKSIANIRAMIDMLNETLPRPIKTEAFLQDMAANGADLVSDIRGMADRVSDLREYDR